MKLKNQIKSLLKYVILAPSGYNTQPWKFKLGDNTLEILPDYSRARINTDPEYREFFMSLGTAATNLQIAAEHFALTYEKSYRLDDQNHDYAIVFKFLNQKTISVDSPLFSAIKTRHTNRFPYENKNIPKNILTELKALPRPDSVELNLVTRPGDITTLTKLINYSFLLWSKQQSLVEELENWLRDDLESSPDGIPSGVINLYKLAINFKYFFRPNDFQFPKSSLKSENLAKNAPALVVISTKKDSVLDWFQAGEFFELFVLTLAVHGFATDFFNYPLVLKKTRQQTAKFLKTSSFPQLFFRFGQPTVLSPRTPRRPLKELLIS